MKGKECKHIPCYDYYDNYDDDDNVDGDDDNDDDGDDYDDDDNDDNDDDYYNDDDDWQMVKGNECKHILCWRNTRLNCTPPAPPAAPRLSQ